MKWEDICSDPTLQDLPYKIELNEWGQIVMTPASNTHGGFQMRIGYLITKLTNEKGLVISECSVKTRENVKVADVAWCSPEFLSKHGKSTPYNTAPEICVEILSPSNSTSQLYARRDLYLDAGAREVWTCDEAGSMCFYSKKGEMARSKLIPGFPTKIAI